MASLLDGVNGHEEVSDIYDKIVANFPGAPHSISNSLWLLRRATEIRADNKSPEKMLEKAVALLAERGHMPGWYNQCPVASGIVTSRSDRNSAVDLVACTESKKDVRLIELKWDSDSPKSALQQILMYGLAYLFCRVHRRELPLHYRSLMDARHIALEVVAPSQYYEGVHRAGTLTNLEAWLDQFTTNGVIENTAPEHEDLEMGEYISGVSQSLDEFAHMKTGGLLSMSLNAYAFPDEFSRIPFNNGQEVRLKCDSLALSEEGRMVRDAFASLASVWS